MKKTLLLSITLLFTTNFSKAQSEVTFYTTMGDFVVETYDTLQPITAGNFLDLVSAEFYDGIIFHRVIDGFVVQGGDPLGTGFGGPGYTIPDEFDTLTSNVQMAISMANAGPNTGGSQFFINLVNNLFLDPNYPVFGIVISNFSVVQSIGLVPVDANDRPLTDVVMDSVRITSQFVGTNDLSLQYLDVSVFPNPAKDYITIHLPELSQFEDNLLEMRNMMGQIVHREYLNKEKTTIDISSLVNKGIYYVHVFNEQRNAVAIKKIVVR